MTGVTRGHPEQTDRLHTTQGTEASDRGPNRCQDRVTTISVSQFLGARPWQQALRGVIPAPIQSASSPQPTNIDSAYLDMHKKNESSYKEFLTISVLVRDMILMLHFVTIQERKDLATEHKNSKKSEKYD